jgi:hypothetical protein
MTVACARCHDHKYDPVSQREFYQLYALLNNCTEPALAFPTEHQAKEEPALLAEIAQVKTRLDDVLKNSPGRRREWERIIRAEIAGLEKGESTPEVLDVLADFTKALDTPEDKRTAEQQKLVDDKFAKNDNERVNLEATLAELNAKHKQLKSKITTTLVVKEMPQPRPAFIHIRGDFLRVGATVEPGTPAVLPEMTLAGERATRLDLARWLVASDNPLTPRVTANRIWQQYFGTGLVSTENDFGTQGERPTHPELLDWLARRLLEHEWSLKQFHRRSSPVPPIAGRRPCGPMSPPKTRTTSSWLVSRGCGSKRKPFAIPRWRPPACCRAKSAVPAFIRRSPKASTFLRSNGSSGTPRPGPTATAAACTPTSGDRARIRS